MSWRPVRFHQKLLKVFMRTVLLYILLTFSIIKSSAQSFNIDASLATDAKNNIFIWNISPGIGYSFTDKDYICGGIKFQSYSLIPSYDRDEDDLWTTTTVLNFMFYAGTRYAQPVIKTKNSKKTLGVFPEVRLYLNPYLPRKIKFIDDNNEKVTVRGDYSMQASLGIGFGIYLMETDGNAYFALKFEYSTIDAFKTLRQLDYKNKHFDFPVDTQFSLGLSIFLW